MLRLTCRWIFAICALAASPLLAQEVVEKPIFAIPDAPGLRCRVSLDSVGPGAAPLGFDFETGSPAGLSRSIDVGFDAAGIPQTLIDVATSFDPTRGATVDGANARFFPNGTVAGFRARFVQSATDMARKSAFHQLLTPDEQHRARTLADWLWRHRCGRDQVTRATASPRGGSKKRP